MHMLGKKFGGNKYRAFRCAELNNHRPPPRGRHVGGGGEGSTSGSGTITCRQKLGLHKIRRILYTASGRPGGLVVTLECY